MEQAEVAIVTGGGNGIGEAIVHQLVDDGFKVGVADMDIENAERVAKDCGSQAKAYKVNVADRAAVGALVDSVVNDFGQLNVMVNNAGISREYPILEMTDEQYSQLLNINVKGVLWGIQAAAKQFIKQGTPGKIISASSMGGYRVAPLHAGYSSTKFAVRSLTQGAARELGPKGITANCYCPGITMTPMMKSIVANYKQKFGEEGFEKIQAEKLKDVSLRRPAEPEDIANVVSFLASHKADYINGQAIIVDGGSIYK